MTSVRDCVLQAWCSRQLHGWEGLALSRGAVLDELRFLNDTQRSLFLFVFEDGGVTLAPKPDRLSVQAEEVERAHLYRRFFHHVVKTQGVSGPGALGMCMSDSPMVSDTAPLFAFQKTAGSKAVLINDIDFIMHDFFRSRAYADPFAYASKLPEAIFLGATTGSIHTVESLQALSDPRIRAFDFFKDSDLVEFRLPRLVHCADAAAAALMVEMVLGTGEQPWRYQFRRKFIISMDGNGATCSRVAIALRSRSVLVKYGSPYELYYSCGLAPWLHYIPVERDAEVADLVRMERESPGRFQDIAREGRRFASDYLSRDMGVRYAGALLRTYFTRVCHRP